MAEGSEALGSDQHGDTNHRDLQKRKDRFQVDGRHVLPSERGTRKGKKQDLRRCGKGNGSPVVRSMIESLSVGGETVRKVQHETEVQFR